MHLRRTRPEPPKGVGRVLAVLAWALLAFVCVEAALQWRSQRLNGDSLFNRLFAEPMYVNYPHLGFTLLQPSRVFEGSRISVRSNRLGLRSDEVGMPRPAGGRRIAIVGASTVMGSHAARNELTIAGQLAELLREREPQRAIEVINAGIVGLALIGQREMIQRVVAPLQPDLIVLYPGFNDFARYCRASARRAAPSHALPAVQLPDWLLTVDMLRKNAGLLRPATSSVMPLVDADALDLSAWRLALEDVFRTAREHGLPLMVSTNARAFRAEQPPDEQRRLSSGARHFNPCLDLQGLHRLYDRHNELVRETASAHGVPLIDLDAMEPHDARYFADANHFSALGDRWVAERLAERLQALPAAATLATDTRAPQLSVAR